MPTGGDTEDARGDSVTRALGLRERDPRGAPGRRAWCGAKLPVVVKDGVPPPQPSEVAWVQNARHSGDSLRVSNLLFRLPTSWVVRDASCSHWPSLASRRAPPPVTLAGLGRQRPPAFRFGEGEILIFLARLGHKKGSGGEGDASVGEGAGRKGKTK